MPHQRKQVKWVAQLSHVQEVSLLGTADLDYWNDRLRGKSLTPTERGGQAQMLLIAAAARFCGLRFRELSISVLAHRQTEGGRIEGAYLLQAFNSRQLFAFCERAFFATPYAHGNVRVATEPAAIELAVGGHQVVTASMESRQPIRTGPDGFDGPVFLPRSAVEEPRMFLARIGGHTSVYSFEAAEDVLAIDPNGNAALQSLVDSHFTPRQWSIRPNADHAKSKTYSWHEGIACIKPPAGKIAEK
ncbi:MAG: hypothetical protein K8T91_01395 [Planctomycetes bacterium]|nr:hypothetical protein [Planctomycetota bacterium]